MFSDSYRLLFTIAVLTLTGMVGCDTVEVEKPSKRAKSSGEKPIIMRKGTVSTSGNDPCPDEADHCRDATYSERQDIIQSLDLQIRKDDPVCEDLYQSAKQFINNGTTTIFPENTFDGGRRMLGAWLPDSFPNLPLKHKEAVAIDGQTVEVVVSQSPNLPLRTADEQQPPRTT